MNRLHFKRTPLGTNQWQSTEYLYDPVGNLETQIQPSGARQTYNYDDANRLHLEHFWSDATTELRYNEYQYDDNNNLTDVYETKYNPSASYHTNYHYTDRDERDIITDGYGGTTTYHYDELGDVKWVTDASNIKTEIFPRTLNTNGQITDEYIEHTDVNTNPPTLLATTTNHYDTSNRLDGWITTDPINNLTLTTDMPFNADGYVEQANVSHTKDNGTPVTLTSSSTYKDNNLLGTWTQQSQNNHDFEYDSAQRLRCYELDNNQVANIVRNVMFYDTSGRRSDDYRFNTSDLCPTLVTYDQTYFNTLWGMTHAHFTYDGNRLSTRTQTALLYGFTDTYGYNQDGDVKDITKLEGNSTVQLTYNWEPGTHRLMSMAHTTNGNSNYSATFEYDHLNRIRKFCPSNGDCRTFSYVGDSDWLATVTLNGYLHLRYLYANGRPLRVDVMDASGQPPYYFCYNARGDAAGFVDKGGSGSTSWTQYGAWGNQNYGSDFYYSWNAAWGYMIFPPNMGFNMHDVYDVGLYFAHGRWYNQDTGLWLSPNDKGDYLYEPHNNPVNIAQSDGCQNHLPPTTPPIGGKTVDWIKNSPNFPPGEIATLQALKQTILASARGHNTAKTNMDDNAFAALMTSILHFEGKLPGNGKPESDQRADQLKSLAAMLFGMDFSTGVAKIKPSVAIEILKGEIRGFSAHYCYDVAGSFTYDDLLTTVQYGAANGTAVNVNALVANQLHAVGISIDFLAANLERGADRVNSKGLQASVFNLATWHNSGTQTPDEFEEYFRNKGEYPTPYGNQVLRAMPTSFDVLGISGMYLPYNPNEERYVIMDNKP